MTEHREIEILELTNKEGNIFKLKAEIKFIAISKYNKDLVFYNEPVTHNSETLKLLLKKALNDKKNTINIKNRNLYKEYIKS